MPHQGGTMPLDSIDPNVGLRFSRSPELSNKSATSDTLASGGPGVMSMLKTSTETGDLGSLMSHNNRRLPKLPSGSLRKPGTGINRVASSHYSRTASLRSKASNVSNHSGRSGHDPMPGSWPHHYAPYGLQDRTQHQDSRSAAAQESVRSLAYDIRERLEQSERSMSLTHSLSRQSEQTLSNHRSLTSLRSVGPFHRPQSPMVYQGKLRRTRDYRPASPALSDSAFVRHPARPGLGPRTQTASNVPLRPPQRQGFAHSQYLTQSGPGLPLRLAPSGYGHPPNGLSHHPFNQAAQTGRLVSPRIGQGNRILSTDHYKRFEDLKRFTPYPAHQHLQPQLETFQAQEVLHGQNEILSDRRMRTLVPKDLVPKNCGETDTAPYVGFVQRVRDVLEERISSEDLKISNSAIRRTPQVLEYHVTELPASPVVKRLTRDMIHDAVALSPPAMRSSLSEADLKSPGPAPDSTVKRLTRELIRAETGMHASEESMVENEQGTPEDMDAIVFELAEQHDQRTGSEISGEGDSSSNGNHQQTLCIHSSNGSSSSPARASTEMDRSNSGADTLHMPGSVTSEVAVPDFLHKLESTAMEVSRINREAQGDAITMFESSLEHSYSNGSFKLNCNNGTSIERNLSTETSSERPTSIHANMTLLSNSPGPTSGGPSTTASLTFLGDVKPTRPEEESSTKSCQDYDLACKHMKQRDIASQIESDRATLKQPVDVSKANESRNQPCFQRHEDTNGSPAKNVTLCPPKHISHLEQALSNQQHAHPGSIGTLPEDDEYGAHYDFQYADTASFANIPSCRSSFNSSQMDSRNRYSSDGNGAHEMRMTGPRFSTAPRFDLPDLTEDSQEDYSITNLRILGASPPMFRRSRVENTEGVVRKSNKLPVLKKNPESYLSHISREGRELPSLQFSRNDLTSKLNRALGIRSSRSFDSLAGRPRSSTLPFTLAENPGSAMLVRDRYRSFFEFVETTQKVRNNEDEQLHPDSAEENTLPVAASAMNGELLDELNRLSIPSVNHLTMRISSLFPTLMKATQSETDLAQYDDGVNQTVDEIQELGSANRLASMDLKKERSTIDPDTPLLFRRSTIQARQSECGKAASTRSGRTIDLMKDLPPLPRDNGEVLASSVKSPAEQLQRTNTGKTENPVAGNTESDIVEVHELDGVVKPSQDSTDHVSEIRESTPICGFKESFKQPQETSPVTPRPWNESENYPWLGTPPRMELSFLRHSHDGAIAHGTSKKVKGGKGIRNADLDLEDEFHVARSMSPGFDAPLIPTTSNACVSEEDDTESRGSKKGVLDALARKMGMKHRIDRSGFPIDPHFLHPEEHVVDPGDRYPTTGLTPPSALTLDGRSYFSDDSSVHEEPKSFRKRLTRLNFRRSPASRPESPMGSADDTVRCGSSHTTPWDDGAHCDSIFSDPRGAGSDSHANSHVILLYERPAAGMSKTEFRAKRLMEKLRVLWAKSGHLLRGKDKGRMKQGGMFDSSGAYVVT
ncbi:hypothetical protein FH972_024370 [Carpinus fangiana]|uniref:Uncharacterized protein n=1 Tax=Carpinus fangiana TaxID=176857 RepID=A0A5N6KYC6_9ROSI|nr:hypothetical protein FH972_024370 [Carpinus fangiana]